jgi:hypothetical protein
MLSQQQLIDSEKAAKKRWGRGLQGNEAVGFSSARGPWAIGGWGLGL